MHGNVHANYVNYVVKTLLRSVEHKNRLSVQNYDFIRSQYKESFSNWNIKCIINSHLRHALY
jgi:hypothetical protein